MAVESASDRAVFFNVHEFGQAATYTPPAGVAIACVVLFSQADREIAFGNGRPIVEGATIAVAADQVAAPVKGGTFTIDGTAHKILSDPTTDDADRSIWHCTVAP